MYLTLPLPVKKRWQHDIYFVPWDTDRPHLKVSHYFVRRFIHVHIHDVSWLDSSGDG